ncbi:helix-turn-helix domain-containing protein [Priestia megaterium]|uniref:helix-turn-helix domain-containing protein n=1 Tax=Priestia megaterium TaxID=1404 RepID=UPI00287756CD|nr:helix-turn-helix domain-containing protein [Priestia megaterium]
MKSKFYLQLPSDLIRDSSLDSATLYTYAKLVQRYYVYKKQFKTFELDHNKFMYFIGIKSNQKFKAILKQLYDKKLIKNQIVALPRRGLINIELDTFFDTKSKKYSFTQFPIEILDKNMLDKVGHSGIRLLLYIKSYINKPTDFCFCSYERMESELDMTENTIIKHMNKLHKSKLIRKERHVLGRTGEYIDDEFGNEKEKVTRYNNHYQIRYENILEID